MLPYALAVALAALQLALAVGWTAYATCLPPLLAAAGLPAKWTPWILGVDQGLFAVLDLALALAMGPVLRFSQRTMPLLIPAVLISVGAMLLLPVLTALGPAVLLLNLLVWVVSTAVLRAPVMMLFARHVPPERHPAGLSLALVGSGLAAGLAPFAQEFFKAGAPFRAFLISSALLAATSLALLLAERLMPPEPAPPRPGPWTVAEAARLMLVGMGILGIALGAQLHLSLRANALLAAFFDGDQAGWIQALGGALAAVAAGLGGVLCARVPAPVLAAAGALGLCAGIGLAAAGSAPLWVAVGTVLAAGAASFADAGAVQGAATSGDPGRIGLFIGVWSGAGALAGMARLGLVATGAAAALPGVALDLGAATAPLLGAGASLVLLVVGRRRWLRERSDL